MAVEWLAGRVVVVESLWDRTFRALHWAEVEPPEGEGGRERESGKGLANDYSQRKTRPDCRRCMSAYPGILGFSTKRQSYDRVATFVTPPIMTLASSFSCGVGLAGHQMVYEINLCRVQR